MEAKPDRLRRTARLAGFLYLWLIVTGLTGAIIISRIVASGSYAQAAARVVAAERLYRVGLLCELIETLSALVLAFALYAMLAHVDKLLAQMAMYWRLAESLIGCVGVIFGFARLNLYKSEITAGAERLTDLTAYAGSAAYNVGALCFSVGSALFFFLFFKSNYIPKPLSAFGVFASIIVTVMCCGNLLFPQYASTLRLGWAPMAVAEVSTGICLMFFGGRLRKQQK
jgi:hypothetical protein